MHDTGGSSENIQPNSDCDDECDENLLDVLLETMRTMDSMQDKKSFFFDKNLWFR